MRKFGIEIGIDFTLFYNHYLSDDFIKYLWKMDDGLNWSRKFDKPAVKWKDGSSAWWLDDKRHRVGKPAIIFSNGKIKYYENGEEVR